MTSSLSTNDAVLAILDAFTSAPLNGITLLSTGEPRKEKEKLENLSFSLLKPQRNIDSYTSTSSPLRLRVAIKRSHSSTTNGSSNKNDTNGTSDVSILSAASGTSDVCGANAKNRSSAGKTAKTSDLIRLMHNTTCSPVFVFPCLSLASDLKCCIRNGTFVHEESDIRYASDLSDLLGRSLVTPLSQLIQRSESITSEIRQCSKDSSLSCSIRNLFNSLIHHRLGFWIEKLQRAVALEEDNVDTSNKRVLVALLDVQSSMEVEDSVDVAFRIPRDRSYSTINAEMQEVVRMEQELADALACLKQGAREFEPGSPLPSFQLSSAARNRERDAVAARMSNSDTDSKLFLPHLSGTGPTKKRIKFSSEAAAEEIKEMTFPVVMDAQLRVRAQIGDDLEQGQTIGLSVSGHVTVFYREAATSHLSPSSWIGMELKLDNENLFSNMEKQARLVARSTAESVLLNAMTEEPAHSGEGDDVKEKSEIKDKPQPCLRQGEKASSSIAPILSASAFSAPVSVSPITSPRQHRTPSPPQGKQSEAVPMVSPPFTNVDSFMLPSARSQNIFASGASGTNDFFTAPVAETDKRSLKPKRLDLRRSVGSFPSETLTHDEGRLSNSDISSADVMEHDAVGALTALKNTVQC